ncbi:MAG: SGNH/GDSL hydrolase family protein [Lachnospiraceae bacterium]|nr:SGNH/GDSL hydrolase family protein [Lachnospiraceae bacterium]
MHKRTLAAVIACILGIVILTGLALYILDIQGGEGGILEGLRHLGMQGPGETESFSGFIFSTEKEAGGDESLTDHSPAAESEKNTEQTPAQIHSQTESDLPFFFMEGETETENVLTHRIIFVGDSRTLGMRDALHRAGRTDDDIFIGKVGEGVRWFIEEGMSEMDDAIEEYPDLPVVFNLGVNDPTEIDDYIVTYWDCIRNHPDTDFYILSVNPIDEEFLLESETAVEEVLDMINNLNIAKLNLRLKEEFTRRYLDSASFLKSDGFETVDGLHFNTKTYLKIHDFVVNELF